MYSAYDVSINLTQPSEMWSINDPGGAYTDSVYGRQTLKHLPIQQDRILIVLH
jgi:hypothetical protein